MNATTGAAANDSTKDLFGKPCPVEIAYAVSEPIKAKATEPLTEKNFITPREIKVANNRMKLGSNEISEMWNELVRTSEIPAFSLKYAPARSETKTMNGKNDCLTADVG